MGELPPVVSPYPRENRAANLEKLLEADAATKKAVNTFLLMFVLQIAFNIGLVAAGNTAQLVFLLSGLIWAVYIGLGVVLAVLAYRAAMAYGRFKETDHKGMAILLAIVTFLP